MKFKKPIEVQAGISDGDPTNPLGISGYLLSSDGSNVNWVSPGGLSAETAEAIVQPIKANEALTKGDPLYIVGFQAGQNANIVAKADSSDVAKMPVVGLADDDYANQAFGTMTAFGSFNGDFDTTGGTESWAVGDIIFVKPGGGLTNIKPGGTDLIQNVAIVSRVNQNTGELEVIALGRTNDVPNLPTGRLFVGTAANTSLASDVIYVDDANERMGIGTTNPGTYKLAVAGSTAIGENLEVSDGLGGDKTLSIDATSGAFQIGDIDGIASEAHIEGDGSNIKIFTSGSETLVCDINQNVGIGTTSPAKKLTVGSIGVGNTDGLKIEDPSNTAYGAHYSYNDGDTTVEIGGVVNNALRDCISIARDATRTITINTSEFVGIGTTNPNAKLEVAGSTRITGSGLDVGYGNNGTNYVQVGFGRTTNGFALIDLIGDSTYTDYGFRILRNNGGPNTDTDILHRGTGDLDLKTIDAGDIGFHTTSIQRMIVKSNGNVGVGTTNPRAKLHVNGGIKLGNDTDPPSASKAGTFRYYTSGNNSYVDMCMQTGASTYTWVNIVTNSW